MNFPLSLASLALAGFVTASAGAQQTPPPASASPQDAPEGHRTVILSRSVSDPEGKAAQAPAAANEKDSPGDAERRAITFLSYDLDVHLRPDEHALTVRARMVVRNDSDSALRRLPLQLSSTLHWTSVRVGDAPAAFSEKLLLSDIDHTAALQEATISLPQPLAPRKTITLDATYEGTAELSARRLEQTGAPDEAAEASDWDRISDDFVGLRGLGNVAWYPIASAPVALGDGAKFFTETAAERQRQKNVQVTMRVTEEFYGEPPDLAVLNGQVFPVKPVSLPSVGPVPGIASVSLPPTPLGFNSLSLFLVSRTVREDKRIAVYSRANDLENAQAYLSATATVTPFLEKWLRTDTSAKLTVIDLPDAGDDAFENGNVLFANVHAAEPEKLATTLVHSLSHLYFQSPYAWLNEGLPSFMSLLWSEQTQGRDAAIQQLDNSRSALSLAEPEDVLAQTGSEALLRAKDPVYYRTKATYVFWMLRDVAGDEALGRALRAYQPEADPSGNGFEQAVEHESHKDLKWFFDNWVYQDRGLPDFSIAGVFPNKASLPGSYIVSVDVANGGTAEAEVPVSVSSGTATVTERLRIPAKSKVSHRFVLQGQPAEVAVNDGSVPEVEASVHRKMLNSSAASE